MLSRERVQRILDHKEADRIPIWDDPWHTTLARWYNEGLPKYTSYIDYFDLDYIARITVDNSPQYTEETIEETADYRVYTTGWGATIKEFKHQTATFDSLDFKITDRKKWEEAKQRMIPSKDRIDWGFLKRNYPYWQEKGFWIEALLWFGFDVTHSRTVGTERLLMAMFMEPDWCVDMFNHFLDINLKLLDMVWDAGYMFDSAFWYDDMGYKNKQFFSLETYRNILKPVHQKAIDWAKEKGLKTHMHSCGDVNPFVSELVDMGLDTLNPLEVKAGMDPLQLKKQYGNQLVLHGGINAVHWDEPEKMAQEISQKVPELKANGGYIFASDHSIPDSVSFKTFSQIIELVKEIGRY